MPNGKTLLGSRRFTNSCAVLLINTDEGYVLMIATTLLHDDFPPETHVFVSLNRKLDITVGLSKSNKNYIVNGDTIRLLEFK